MHYKESNSSEESDCHGNDCYYGYSIDLLQRLSKDLHFNYELYMVKDGKYGAMDEVTRTWNGVVAELIPDAKGDTVRIKTLAFNT